MFKMMLLFYCRHLKILITSRVFYLNWRMLGLGTFFDQVTYTEKVITSDTYPFQRTYKPLKIQMAMWFMKLTVFLLHCTPLFIIFCLFSSRLHPLILFYVANWIFCSAQKFTQCLFHMAQGKKVCYSIHCTNRKNNYSPYSSPNTYLYSFPRSDKLKDSKGSLCQYLCCREWVQEKNTQWC